MQEHKIKYDGCTYRCYLKSVKKQTTDALVSIHPSGTQPKGLPLESSYFRVYCRRVDPKCKVAVHPKVIPTSIPPKPKPKVSIDERNIFYHGTHKENVVSILTEGLRPSTKGTVGPSVYLSPRKEEALYERNPGLSAAVKKFGRQPDTILEVRLNGKLYDAGKMDTKDGPNVYLRPHVFAADKLYGKTIPFNKKFNNAPELLKQKGYIGVRWEFADGRQAIAVFDPKDIGTIRLSNNKTVAKKITESAEKMAQMQAELKRQEMKGKLKPATLAEVKILLNEQAYKLPYERYVMAVREADFPGDFPMNATTKAMHKQAVERALAVGKTVPHKVLSEYPGVEGVPEPVLPYHRMTIGKFIDKYDLQIGDPVVSHAWAFAKETNLSFFKHPLRKKKSLPGLPKGVDGQEIVKATITGFFTSAVTGEPMARLRAKKIIAYSRSKGPVDPKSKHADALKDWEGVNSINEIGYGEVHKRFIKKAMDAGEKIPAKVLQEYPEL